MNSKDLRLLRKETNEKFVQRVKALLYGTCGLDAERSLEVLKHARISISLDIKPKKHKPYSWKKI